MARLLRRPMIGRLRIAARNPYQVWVEALQRWPMHGLALPPVDGARSNAVLAYVLLQDPGLTETFIRRELAALIDSGVRLELFVRSGRARDEARVPSPAAPIRHFGPVSRRRGRAAVRRYFVRAPWRVVRLYLFIVRHPYRTEKRWWRDRDVLYEAAQLADALREHDVSRVHAPWANHGAILAFVASSLLRVPFTVQARASEIHRVVERSRVPDRIRFADFVITNSAYNARYLRGLLNGYRVPPIHVIPNGLTPSDYARDPRREVGAPLRLVAIGRLVEPKGFGDLLTACARMRDAGLAFQCDIIGGPQDDFDTVTWVELRRQHSALALDAHVRFLGAQSSPVAMEMLSRADIFVLPCGRGRDGSHDITPNSLLEAMAMGLPVVSTTSGAIPELVEDGVSGILVPPGDTGALARSIFTLAADQALCRRLGEAARRRVEEGFDASRNAAARAALFSGEGDRGESS